jgi:hypothetical protein
MKKLLSTAAIIAAATLITATAHAKRPIYAYQGVGVGACEVLNKHSDDKQWVSEYHSWAQGFISGMNMASGLNKEDGKDLNSLTVTDQVKILAVYCKQHPKEQFMSAIYELYRSLDDYKHVETDDTKTNERVD